MNDTLTGSAGLDTLAGGAGDDTYVLRTFTDAVVENLNEGIDRVIAPFSYTLPSHVEHLTLAPGARMLTFGWPGETVAVARVADASNPIVGSWTASDASGSIVITFLQDGTYILAEQGEADFAGHTGMEHGTYAWNSSTGAFSSAVIADTNGEWGLSHPAGSETVQVSGSTLSYTDDSATFVFSRVAGSGIVGGWYLYSPGGVDDAGGPAVVSFLADGTFMFAQDGDPALDPTGQDGLEYGTYAWNSSTGALSITTTIDTTGEWGLNPDIPQTAHVTGASGTGNASNNVITGNEGANLLSGLGGNDTLIGKAGNDTLSGGAGRDTASYAADAAGVVVDLGDGLATDGAGNTDQLLGIENVIGSAFDDAISGNGFANVLNGGAGNDTLDGMPGAADTLRGGAGNDYYVVDVVNGLLEDVIQEGVGAGIDTLVALGPINDITEMPDPMTGSFSYTLAANFEKLFFFDDGLSQPDDALWVMHGVGNALHNTIVGNGAGNLLAGEGGNDSLYGHGSVDRLEGGAGNDLLDGGSDADDMAGGAGNDIYIVDHIDDLVSEAAAEGSDLVKASVTYQLPSQVEKLLLTGATAINGIGNAMNNTLTGNSAANVLKGLGGNDRLVGGAGGDLLYGGLGSDTLGGGGGADKFVFDSTLSSVDQILDFQSGIDKIRLDDDVFTAFGQGTLRGLEAGQFALGTQAGDADDRIVYDSASGALYYDADGTGGTSAVQFATLGTSTHPALAILDFQIIA